MDCEESPEIKEEEEEEKLVLTEENARHEEGGDGESTGKCLEKSREQDGELVVFDSQLIILFRSEVYASRVKDAHVLFT